jgi:hypothetical protein
VSEARVQTLENQVDGELRDLWSAIGDMRVPNDAVVERWATQVPAATISSGSGTADSPYELDEGVDSSGGSREIVPAQMVEPVVIVPGETLSVPPPYRRTPPYVLRRSTRRSATPYDRLVPVSVAGPSRLVAEVEADDGDVADSEPETDRSYPRSSPVA